MSKSHPAFDTLLKLAVIAFWVLPATARAGEPDLRPGKWETKVVMQMNGMTVPARVTSRCITRDDLVPPVQTPGRQDECEMVEHRIDGNVLTWKVRCDSGDGTSEGVGTIHYRGETYSGDIRMTMQSRTMGQVSMTQTLTGRRIGDC